VKWDTDAKKRLAAAKKRVADAKSKGDKSAAESASREVASIQRAIKNKIAKHDGK
jgi:hypothetical protein